VSPTLGSRALPEHARQKQLDWYAEKWVASRPWAVARGLKGLDGAVAYLTALRDLEDGLLSEWPAPVLVVEPSVGDWEQRTKCILEFLGVPPSMESQPPAEAVRQIVGVYVDAAGECLPRNGAEDIAVRSEAGGLHVYGLFWRRSRLVHVGGERYAVLGLPLDVSGTILHAALPGGGSGLDVLLTSPGGVSDAETNTG